MDDNLMFTYVTSISRNDKTSAPRRAKPAYLKAALESSSTSPSTFSSNHITHTLIYPHQKPLLHTKPHLHNARPPREEIPRASRYV